MRIEIRPFRPSDAGPAGRLIAETFRKFNLAYAPPAEQEKLLGPFRNANSEDRKHRHEIARVIDAPWALVAIADDRVVGVLRGSPGRLHSLFVRECYHRQGIGRRLMETFERKCLDAGAEKITLQATLFAVPFYRALGYKRSTGVRSGRCFDGDGFPYQPMKKLLAL